MDICIEDDLNTVSPAVRTTQQKPLLIEHSSFSFIYNGPSISFFNRVFRNYRPPTS